MEVSSVLLNKNVHCLVVSVTKTWNWWQATEGCLEVQTILKLSSPRFSWKGYKGQIHGNFSHRRAVDCVFGFVPSLLEAKPWWKLGWFSLVLPSQVVQWDVLFPFLSTHKIPVTKLPAKLLSFCLQQSDLYAWKLWNFVNPQNEELFWQQ